MVFNNVYGTYNTYFGEKGGSFLLIAIFNTGHTQEYIHVCAFSVELVIDCSTITFIESVSISFTFLAY